MRVFLIAILLFFPGCAAKRHLEVITCTEDVWAANPTQSVTAKVTVDF